MKQKLILLALVISLTIVSQSTLSLGMGNIQVYSSLDEQLRSTIELMTNPDEDLQNLTVKLASNADYKRVGLDRSFVPSNILVNLDADNPNMVNVTSNGPVSEPIISLLLDVNWNNGRILREFTILLDPPVYDAPSTNVQVNNVVVDSIQEQVADQSETQTEPVLEEREAEETAPQTTYTNEDLVQYEQPSDPVSEVEYQQPNEDVYVNEGDTLWGIANRNKLGGLSTNQMMMAIYNSNSDSFLDNNINKLIKGSQLKMPSLEQAEAISYSEALAQVESHHQSWAPAQQDYSSYQTTEDSYTDTTDTSSGLDFGVQLSGGDSDGSDSGLTNAEVGDSEVDQLSAEEQYNQESESADLQERISELEDIVEQQQSVIEVSDDSLANLESQLGDGTDDAIDSMNEEMTDTVNAVDDVWDTTVDEVSDEVDEAMTGGDNGLSLDIAAVDMSSDEELTMTDEVTNELVDDEVVEEKVKSDPPKFSAAVQEEPSMVDTAINWVMDNLKWVLIGLGGLVLLLIVPRFLRKDDADDDETSFLDDIKQRKTVDDETEAELEVDENYESVDTKVNQPLDENAEDDSAEDSEDVLAALDKSIAFDENDSDEDAEDVFESEATASDDFDLDGFLNDGDNDTSVTADHSETLAAGGFESGSEDDAEGDSLTETPDDAFEEVSFDDLGMDLDDLDDDVKEAVEEVAHEAEETAEDINEDFNIDEELEDLDLDGLDDLAEADVSTEEALTNDTADSDDDDFSFDEDFDFDLDDEEDETDKGTDEPVSDDDSNEEFDDLLDLSDESETFDTETSNDMDDEIDLGLEGLLDDGDAIDTKLDLAKAYLEMGDVEGAKNLLEEVVSEGSESQVEAAKKIIDDM